MTKRRRPTTSHLEEAVQIKVERDYDEERSIVVQNIQPLANFDETKKIKHEIEVNYELAIDGDVQNQVVHKSSRLAIAFKKPQISCNLDESTSTNNKHSNSTNPEKPKKSVYIKKADKPATCIYCGKIYCSRSELIKHWKQYHIEKVRDKIFDCKFCKKSFYGGRFFELHLRFKHYGAKPVNNLKHECDYCGRVCKKRTSILKHIQTHLAPIECKICHIKIKPLSMQAHMSEIHTDPKTFECKICRKIFKAQSYLNVHLKYHDKKLECHICGKKYVIMFELKRHLRNYHENPGSFSCDLCGKRFNVKGDVRKHMVCHNKNRPKPIKCQRCNFCTDKKRNMAKHLRFHKKKDEKYAGFKNPVQCDMCGNWFKNKVGLRGHMKVVHTDTKFRCEDCGIVTKLKTSLARHKKGFCKGRNKV